LAKIWLVRFPDERSWAFVDERLGSLNSPEQAFANSARPGIEDEGLVVQSIQEIIQEAVDDAVSDAGHGDFPSLIVADRESAIAPVVVGAFIQISKKGKEVLLKMILELMKFIGRAFAFAERKPTLPDIF
jgi:hypothetical protein